MSNPSDKIRIVEAAPDGYRVGKWGPVNNYECETCEFKVTTLDYMIDHVKEHKAREAWEQTHGKSWSEVFGDDVFASQTSDNAGNKGVK